MYIEALFAVGAFREELAVFCWVVILAFVFAFVTIWPVPAFNLFFVVNQAVTCALPFDW
jgi:hypothetical protein